MKKYLLSASVTVLAVSAVAMPAVAADTTPTSVEAVIVTGTRTTGLKASDSSAPIQVLDSGSLKRVGQSELIAASEQDRSRGDGDERAGPAFARVGPGG